MRRVFLSVTILLFIQPVSAQFKNSKLADLDGQIHPPGGPSITINHKNPANIVAGIEKDKVMYTRDGGVTWAETKIQSALGVTGYPTLISDSKGELFLFHMSRSKSKGESVLSDAFICQRSSDEAITWKASEPFGSQLNKTQYRLWPSVALKKQNLYTTWTQFDRFEVSDTSFHSNIMFSKSESEGKKWSKSFQINQLSGDCAIGDYTTMGAMTAVDAKGRIFAVWANNEKLYLDRSYDNGSTWLNNDITIAHQYGGWALDIPGVDHGNGAPVLMIDNSPSRYHGSLYVVWADQQKGRNNTDIWLIRSGNGGDNWTQPLRVNKDQSDGQSGKHQFMPWLTVDQTTGYIYIIYYDRRNYDDLQTDVYMAYSADGGNSFGEVKISESPFVPGPGFSPEHNNVAAYKGVVAPIWTRMDNGKTSVWVSVIRDADFQKK